MIKSYRKLKCHRKRKPNFFCKMEEKEILQDFMDNLENEDYYVDIFKGGDSESEDSDTDINENVGIENLDVNVETNRNEIIDSNNSSITKIITVVQI